MFETTILDKLTILEKDIVLNYYPYFGWQITKVEKETNQLSHQKGKKRNNNWLIIITRDTDAKNYKQINSLFLQYNATIKKLHDLALTQKQEKNLFYKRNILLVLCSFLVIGIPFLIRHSFKYNQKKNFLKINTAILNNKCTELISQAKTLNI